MTEGDQPTRKLTSPLYSALNLSNRVVGGFRTLRFVRDQLARPGDDGKQIIDVVGRSSGQAAQGFHLLGFMSGFFQSFLSRHVRNCFDHVQPSVIRYGFRPLDQEMLIVGKRDLVDGNPAGLHRLRHLAEGTRRGTSSNGVVTGPSRQVP